MSLQKNLFSADFWRRYLLETFLQYWQRHSLDRRHGGYIADFDRQWRFTGPGHKSLVSQARLLYTFSAGLRHSHSATSAGAAPPSPSFLPNPPALADAAPSCLSHPSQLPGPPAFAEAAAHGLRFLQDKMIDPEHGGWLWRVRQDGSILEPVKHTYGHAFLIFGLSELARATGDKEPALLALRTLQCLRDRTAGPGGGLWSIMDRAWQPLDRRRGQNPHMHLLEACMSLHDATADPLAMETALQIADLAATRFVHPRYGCLEEYFDEDWSALTDEDASVSDTSGGILGAMPGAASSASGDGHARRHGPNALAPDMAPSHNLSRTQQAGPIQVGHQFEWCWLLNRLADRTGQERWRDLGDQLADWGLRFGTDRQHGGFFNSCSRQGDPLDTNKSHWVESESLRALLYLLIARKRDSLREPLIAAADFTFAHFADPDYGGWYSSVQADGTPENTNKGSEWKLDYHMTSLCDEALRLLQ